MQAHFAPLPPPGSTVFCCLAVPWFSCTEQTCRLQWVKERNILWRYFTAVNENIANSDVCRKEILCCGSKKKRGQRRRPPGTGQRSLAESFQRIKEYSVSLYSGENDVSIRAYVRCSVVVLINWREICHHSCYFSRLIPIGCIKTFYIYIFNLMKRVQ